MFNFFGIGKKTEKINITNASNTSNTSSAIDVVFTLDTTASMGPWIERSKKTIGDISKFLSDQDINVRFNVIGYKDVCDRKCPIHSICPTDCKKSQWVQISGFTDNADDIVNFLEKVPASGGGDLPEDLFGALQIACSQEWRDLGKKVIVVISDAPPHGNKFSNHPSNTPNYPLPYDGSKLPIEIANELKEKNIQVFMLYVEENIMEKTSNFLKENNVTTQTTNIIGEPWKFSLIIPDDLTCMAMDIEDIDNISLVDGLDGPLSSAFFQLRRGLGEDKLKPLIENCFKTGMKDTMRLVLYIRDRTGDIKEKDLGRNAFWILRQLDSNFTSQYYKEFVNETGCFNDLLHLAARADQEEIKNENNKLCELSDKREHRELLFMAVATMQCYLKYIDTKKGQKILKSLNNNRIQRHYRLRKALNKESLSKITNSNNIDLPPYFIYKWLPKFGASKRKNGSKRLKKWERENRFATRLSKLMFVHQNDDNVSFTKKSIEEPVFSNKTDFLDANRANRANRANHANHADHPIPSRQIINFLNVPKKDHPEREAFYREIYSFISYLSDNLPVEVQMCANDWDNIDLSKVTVGAQHKYKKCFSQKIPDKLQKTIKNGKVKTTTLQGHEMVSHFISSIMSKLIGEQCISHLENEFVNAQWNSYFKNNKLRGNYSFQIDCTGSMLSGKPMSLAIALSLFLLSGESKFISFENPEWKKVEGKTLEEQVKSILSHPRGIHGNIPKGVELAMTQETQPDVHFVLTDGHYPRMNLKETVTIRNKLNRGSLTRIVILNLRTDDNELLMKKPKMLGAEEVYIVSGHSPALIKLFATPGESIEKQISNMLREKYPLND